MWSPSNNVSFGTVNAGSILKTSFVYTGIKNIKDIDVFCNCVNTQYVGNTLIVTWKTKPHVPHEIKSEKIVMVVYEDMSFDEITLTATITPN